jgi:hypothetical protein
MFSPFNEDWRDCLGAHFRYTVRNHDHATEKTVADILRETGLTDAQIGELRVTAALRTEDLPDGYLPDLDGLAALAEQQAERPVQVAVPDIAPLSQTQESEALELVGDNPALDLLDALAGPAVADEAETPGDDDAPPPADAPVQMSLF